MTKPFIVIPYHNGIYQGLRVDESRRVAKVSTYGLVTRVVMTSRGFWLEHKYRLVDYSLD
jgi:hypothetical protein